MSCRPDRPSLQAGATQAAGSTATQPTIGSVSQARNWVGSAAVAGSKVTVVAGATCGAVEGSAPASRSAALKIWIVTGEFDFPDENGWTKPVRVTVAGVGGCIFGIPLRQDRLGFIVAVLSQNS